MPWRVGEALPEVDTRGPAVAAIELRLADPAERLGEAPSLRAHRQVDPAAAELEPAQHGREVVARGVDAEARCRQLIGCADTIEQTGRVDERNRAVTARAQMKLVILSAVREGAVEPAHRPQPLAPQQHRRGVHEVSEEHRGEQVAGVDQRCRRVRWRGRPDPVQRRLTSHDVLEPTLRVRVVERSQVPLADDRAVSRHGRHVGPHHSDFGVRSKHPDLGVELPRAEGVVGIEKRDEFAARIGETAISCGRDAAVLLEQVADTRPITLDHTLRIVGGPVVDDDDLVIVVRLGEHALDGRTDDGRAVVRRDHDRDHPRDPWPFQIMRGRRVGDPSHFLQPTVHVSLGRGSNASSSFACSARRV